MGRLVWAFGWRRRRNGAHELRVRKGGAELTGSLPPESHHADVWSWLFAAVRRPEAALSCVERVTPEPGRSAGFATLAEAAGVAEGMLASWGVRPAGERPKAVTWRRDVLGIGGRTGAAAAERAALMAWMGDTKRRKPVVWPIEAPPDYAPTGHVAEAAGIALWSMGFRVASGNAGR